MKTNIYSCIISFSIKPLNKGYHPAKIIDAIMLLILNLSTINYFPFQSFHAKKKKITPNINQNKQHFIFKSLYYGTVYHISQIKRRKVLEIILSKYIYINIYISIVSYLHILTNV